MVDNKQEQGTETKRTRTKHGKYKKEQGVSTLQPDLPLLLTVEMAARIGGWSQPFVRQLCRSGEVPSVRVGTTWRINRDAFLEQLGL